MMSFFAHLRTRTPNHGVLGSVLLCFVVVLTVFVAHTSARYMTSISDTLSTSAPSAFANHTIEFTVDTDIPPSGFIVIRPEDGAFNIPTSTFSYRNIEVATEPSGGSFFTTRLATSTPDSTHDGVSIMAGTSGFITITMNDVTGIPAGSVVRVALGTNTAHASSTLDTGIQNPVTPASYGIQIDAGGGLDAHAKTLVAIIEQVGVGPVNTKTGLPPFRFNGAPTSTLSHTTANVELSLETDKLARCRFALTAGSPYGVMSNQFSGSALQFGGFQIVHTYEISGLTPDTTHSYFVRCLDLEGNINQDDYLISFRILPVPLGGPGTGSTTDGRGGPGAGGTGNGSTGSGGGSSSGPTGGSGGGGSGGGGGTSSGNTGGANGGGSFEPTPAQYESGDGQVIITGYAFPGSTVTALVDGFAANTAHADASGIFSVTINQIAHGVYTFGVYATDPQGVKSSTFTTTFTVTGARSSALSNIHIMPTVVVTPNPVAPGATVQFSGYAIPNSTVTVETQRDKSSGSEKQTLTAQADSNGKWSTTLSTVGLQKDIWKVRARSSTPATGVTSQFSNYTTYAIGQAAPKTLNSDLNRDGKVNLVDFSILLFWWGTAGGSSNPPADINGDGKVNLTDFSIMIFNWTG
jgi:Bacterial Ig domain/Dockerin type I domain